MSVTPTGWAGSDRLWWAVVAYELGLLCDIPENLGPEEMLCDLCAAIEPTPEMSQWLHGEFWVGCDVDLSPPAAPVYLQANVGDTTVADMALLAVNEGVIADPLEFRALVSITLVGEVNWEPIRVLIRTARNRWRGLLFDEVSGFRATVD